MELELFYYCVTVIILHCASHGVVSHWWILYFGSCSFLLFSKVIHPISNQTGFDISHGYSCISLFLETRFQELEDTLCEILTRYWLLMLQSPYLTSTCPRLSSRSEVREDPGGHFCSFPSPTPKGQWVEGGVPYPPKRAVLVVFQGSW